MASSGPDSPLRRRRRGVLLTRGGLARVYDAQRRLEQRDNDGARISLERLSESVGISARTLAKVLARHVPVDRRTLEYLFAALELQLQQEDMDESVDVLASSTLPVPRTAFFGREDEIERLTDAVKRYRLVTITGAGGIGKTRLTLEYAASTAVEPFDRPVYADLSVLTDESTLPSTILGAFGLRPQTGALGNVIAEAVGMERLLLIVDNCEHLARALAPIVDRLVMATPALTVLVTSREPLGVEGERIVRLQPLIVPPPNHETAESALAYPAVALFADRARAYDDTFVLDDATAPLVCEIVRRVDGLPLAVELTAAYTNVMDLTVLLHSLHERLDFPGDASARRSPRHRTARSMVDWSYRLLDEAEQRVLRSCGTFMGNFAADALIAIVPESSAEETAAILGTLVRKSLVVREGDAFATRYRMLEVVRHFVLAELRLSGEVTQRRRLHAKHYTAVARYQNERLGTSDQLDALEALDRERLQMREALEWAASSRDTLHLLAALASRLFGYWHARGAYAEGERWLTLASACDIDLCDAPTRACVHEGLALLAQRLGHLRESVVNGRIAIELYDAIGDSVGSARARNTVAIAAFYLGDSEAARSAFEANLREAERTDNLHQQAVALLNLGRLAARNEHDGRRAGALFERSLEIARRSESASMVVVALANLAEASADAGLYEQAIAYARDGCSAARALGNPLCQTVFALRLCSATIAKSGPMSARSTIAGAIEWVVDERPDEQLIRELTALRKAYESHEQHVDAARFIGASQRIADALPAIPLVRGVENPIRATASEPERVAYDEGRRMTIAECLDAALAALGNA